MKVYYLGPVTSFSHQLARLYFKNIEADLTPCSSFEEISDSIGSDALGILPVENSTTSNVAQGIELIIEQKLRIVGEGYLPININIAVIKGAKLESIKVLHGHQIALKQCSNFIKKLGLKSVEHKSNSAAQEALILSQDTSSAAICGNELLDDKVLEIAAKDLNNYKNNLTRFLIVKKGSEISQSGDKLTVLFNARHEPGSLAKALQAIADLNINLTKISSHQIPGTDWEYMFWIDLELNGTLDEFENSFKNVVQRYEIIGRYNRGKVYNT
jgi:prephenate dehydratase